MSRWKIRGYSSDYYFIFDPDEPEYALEIRRISEYDWFIQPARLVNDGIARGPSIPLNWAIIL